MFFYGRGVFNYTFGPLPYRNPIHVVVGEPIPVEKVEEPSQEQIDQLHDKYTEALKGLFDKYKGQYQVNKDDGQLIIQ